MFDLFATSNYTFLQLEKQLVGNVIKAEYEATGIVKLRDGLNVSDNMEVFDSSSTIHIRPNEPFVATLNGKLVGNGIRTADGVTYRIEGQLEGKDFDTGAIEFYKLTLKREDYGQSNI
jgi:hypothetical protein